MTERYSRDYLLLLAVAATLLLAGLGLRDPWPADEPRFALIARDMAESGQWLIPRVGGVLYPDKPPLFFWFVAVVYGATNSIRIAFLTPGLVSGLGILVLVVGLARRLWDKKTALWCGATLLAMLQFPMQMKAGQIDALLCLWTTLGLVGFARHCLLGPDWRWYAIGGAAAGLGVITKGVGFLPYLVFLPYAMARRGRWPLPVIAWRDWRWLLAPAATLAVIALWLVPILVAAKSDPAIAAYRDNLLFHQTVTRYADSWGHIRPPWYLLTNAVWWLWLPVTALLPWLLPKWRDDWRRRDATVLLPGLWILLVLVFFSLSPGKRAVYILPALPALALVAGRHAEAVLSAGHTPKVLAAVPAILGAALLLAAGIGTVEPTLLLPDDADFANLGLVLIAAAATGAAMLVTLVVGRKRLVAGFAGAMSVFWIAASVFVAPPMNAERSGRALVQDVAEALPSDTRVGLVGWPEQFLLQWDGPVTHFGYRRGNREAELEDALMWLSADAPRRLLLPSRYTADCFDAARLESVGTAHRRTWWLADANAVLPACRQPALVAPELEYQYWSHSRREPLRLPLDKPGEQQLSRARSGFTGSR